MPRNLKHGEDLDWNLAPEDATHVLYGVWRKIIGEEAFHWDDTRGRWIRHPQEDAAKMLLGFIALIAKPLPVVVINGIEIDWNKAPAGTTHAMHDVIAIRHAGQWRRLANGKVHDWRDGEWKARSFGRAEGWLHANKGLYVQHPNLAQQLNPPAVAPIAPEPKKPVGWWN